MKPCLFACLCCVFCLPSEVLEQKREEIKTIEKRMEILVRRRNTGPTEEDFAGLEQRLRRLEGLFEKLLKYGGDKKVLGESVDRYKTYKKEYAGYLYEIQSTVEKKREAFTLRALFSPDYWVGLARSFLNDVEIAREDSEEALQALGNKKKMLEKELGESPEERTDL
ncbi:MAG: uncharacterized protein A8A55_2460 [Amphiamblys sp. WSBS2006]|nr:MAG: uncharacterized protein A8A55_2460 [Amphiamblys sp. WSBS2006]